MIVDFAATAVFIGLLVLFLCALVATGNAAAWAVQRARGRWRP